MMDTLSASGPRSVTYNLDKAGNRTSIVDTGVTKSYTPNNLNEYTAAEGTAVTNGSEHEVASYQSVGYAYINDERLKTVTSGSNSYSLAYDALGRCVKRTLNGVTTYYIYDGEKPIGELFANGTSAGGNIYGKGIDEILVRVDYVVNPAGVTYFYQQDHEGSVTHLTDASGAVIEKYRYDAFGAPTFWNAANTQIPSSNYNNRFLFTGREYASTFGIYEYRARAHHPTLGRFMSEDPKLFDAGDYNLYRYCHNDPEDMTDPMGLWPVPPAGIAPPPSLQSLMRQLSDLSERAQSTDEMDHTPNANASIRQSYARINEQKLSQLGSVFRPMASRFIGSANETLNPEGYEVKIADQGGYRSFEEQARLRAIYETTGRNKANRPGESAHNYGAAIDVDIIKGSRANEDIGRGAYNSLIGRLGALGESQGLIWGGRFNDPPHFQYPGIPVSGPAMLRLHQQLLRTSGVGLDTLMGVP